MKRCATLLYPLSRFLIRQHERPLGKLLQAVFLKHFLGDSGAADFLGSDLNRSRHTKKACRSVPVFLPHDALFGKEALFVEGNVLTA